MFSLIFMLVCLLLLAIGLKGPGLVEKWAAILNEGKEQEQDYKDRTIRALERMASATPLEEEEVEEDRSTLDCFLEGNKKILEKQKVKQAMRDELGIN